MIDGRIRVHSQELIKRGSETSRGRAFGVVADRLEVGARGDRATAARLPDSAGQWIAEHRTVIISTAMSISVGAPCTTVTAGAGAVGWRNELVRQDSLPASDAQ
ncbi:hypothetical protein [Herbidospora cretacea]|uniref:hypothetical protein n=1 Tax=Herbidospora cretacea TaxID=28444 RepID=UPI0012DEEBB3|nr:hypothetical protein [Herbidospora cretacea]